MLHNRGGYHADPYCEGARGLIISKEIDVQADARPHLQRDRFQGRNSARTRRMPPQREHAIQYVASDKRLWATSVNERHETIGRNGVYFTGNRNLRCNRGVVEGKDTADEAGAMVW